MKQQKQSGFTLVELAVALMVIGLLIGGILKGLELIENAKITNTVKDLHDFDAAVTIFYNSYNDYPGHFDKPTVLPNCASDTRCGGTDTSQEVYARFWLHLNRAGLISNIHEDAYNLCVGPTVPTGDYGRYFAEIYYADSAPYWMRAADFQTPASGAECEHRYTRIKTAYAIDVKMDDGKPRTGIIQGMNNSCGATSSNEYLDVTEQTDYNCGVGYQLNSMR